MAAGEGTRLRPLTDHWPKPVLPIDGRPVVATLVRALRSSGCEHVTVVTGYLISIAYVRQPQPDGSADAVRRALAGGAEAPVLVAAADTLFARGTFEAFVKAWNGAAGAVAARRGQPPGGGKPGLDPRLVRAHTNGRELTSVPLWGVGVKLIPFLEDLPGPPFELADAFGRALDTGVEVRGIVVRGTRDLTYPVDLIRENFPYLRS